MRYRMSAQVIFRWKKSSRDHFQGEGLTRDISLAGIYILAGTCPPVDSIIQVAIIIPPLFNASKREIKAEMRVLRVEHDAGGQVRSGFSAVGKCFALGAAPKRPSDAIANVVEEFEEE
jgi:hypothetical protein